MEPNDSKERGIFTTGTSISDSNAWFLSLIRQIRQFRTDRNTPHATVTAQADPTALDKLVDPPSPIVSLFRSIIGIFNDWRHPRHIEMTATPIEVADLWSKKENHIPGLLSVFIYVGVISALLVYSEVSAKWLKPVAITALDTDTIVLAPPPPTAPKSGGGGGGGNRSPLPASKGELPRISTIQLVPPTPIITNFAPELVAEPTIIGTPTPRLGLMALGDPNGVVGPPSAGPGTGGGIGTGDGHGVGSGTGGGNGPGSGGGSGGGTYRIGKGEGMASAPSCPLPNTEPNYTDDARKAHIQGTVSLDVVVNKDGTMKVQKVASKLGYGLDDEASRFVEKYFKCKPGQFQGQAVATQARIDVNFHLY